MRFPRRPLREVETRYVRQTGCPSHVAVATLDFEPLPAGRFGYVFVNDLSEEPAGRYTAECVDALNNGIQLHLAGVGYTDLTRAGNRTPPAAFTAGLNTGVRVGDLAGAPFIAVVAVLREMTIHEVDSSEIAFRRAGWLGARKAVELDGT